ncbi:vomeronasal type-2 receptor 26-like [Nycticebus coucang]|uniref:vomeronasal type-2 receptor 26-like n=1 Tax=Nycticebus coucang TaxID=9470 RepID=UPI00234D7DF8|nr:vomeronasal type-2 receptor 26-like [Nycticebus coucang]
MSLFRPQLLQHLRKVRFKTPDGTEITFDANGDLVTEFDVLHGQKTAEGLFHFVHIGTIKRASLGDRMTVQVMEEELQLWSGDGRWAEGGRTTAFAGLQRDGPPGVHVGAGSAPTGASEQLGFSIISQVPSSVCSRSCAPGFSQIPQTGFLHCCFDCSPCPEGQFADQIDMKQCLPCPEEQYSSSTRDSCLPRTETFLAFEEPMGLTLASVALMLAGLAVLVLGVFLKHRDTPVVRANNTALSYMLLTSLALSALLFIGRPTAATCFLRQTTFAIVFTVAVSSILAKTLTVVLAFRITRPGDRVQMCLGPNASTLVVLVASLVQLVLCGVWIGTSPPFPDRDTVSEPSHIVIQCQEGSGITFSCVLGYLGLLAGFTFSVAFLARGLPDAFNETKFLTFNMLLFCSVWTTFLPLYHSARGKSTVAVEIFSILASTAGLLGSIFIPKCYIILLKPERNTPGWLRREDLGLVGKTEQGAPELASAQAHTTNLHKPVLPEDIWAIDLRSLFLGGLKEI